MVDFEALDERLEQAARRRISATESERETTLASLDGDPLTSEPNTSRRRAASLRREASISNRPSGAEARQGPRSNFVPVAFLEAGAMAARSVARVSLFGGSRTGTGFLISPDLFITNFHVLPSPDHANAAEIEFELEVDPSGRTRPQTVYRLDADRLFIASDVDLLDYVIVAVGERVSGPRQLQDFGYNALSASANKHAIGEFANIIQHPDGRPKEVVLQDNLIAARYETALHYLADTEPGSSGSPVFNNLWQVIALHHWGAVKDPGAHPTGFAPDSVNEGIRISRIVKDITEQQDGLAAPGRELVINALDRGNSARPYETTRSRSDTEPVTAPHQRVNADGTVTWQIPVEITVGIGGVGHAPASAAHIAPTEHQSRVSTDTGPGTGRPFGPEARDMSALAASEGYDPNFLPGVAIPLPEIRDGVAVDLFPQFQRCCRPSHELAYTHFSVVMHKERKMAMLTACNIDGKSVFGLTRKTGERYLYADKPQAISARLAEAAEASSWFYDDRIAREFQTGAPFYDRRNNNRLSPGEDQDFAARIDFSRGHIVRRLDPVWGTLEQGLAADADSHAWPNVAPQTSKFNAHNRDSSDWSPGEEKRLWAALENTILRAAHDDKKRITVFGGPIFSDDDPVYAGLPDNEYRRQVPLEFWKVACWLDEDGDLRSLAMRVSQRDTLLRAGAEALDDTASLLALKDFLTTVAKLEEDIDMRFPDAVRQADIRRGRQGEELATLSFEETLDRVSPTR